MPLACLHDEHGFNTEKPGDCDDTWETSTVAESEAEEKPRWADLADTDEEEGSFLQAPQPEERKPRWVDLVDSEDEKDSLPLDMEPRVPNEFVPTPLRRRAEAATETAPTAVAPRSKASTPVAQNSAKGRRELRKDNEYRPKDVSNGPMQAAGKGNGKSRHRKGKGKGKGSSDKLQCQFIIGIEEDAEFGVVRRILGRAGANMKSVAERTGVKLRLRGRGSKFLEGPEQQESTDDLMLCVSGQDDAGFQLAKDLVSEILRDIYKQNVAFCRRVGKAPPALNLQMHDGYRVGSR